ncbi:Patatin-like phospholipase domain-containing protein [Seminavis robusta]|uniref:Patatin-like phospholipase domain-containing protein n=1 Tax=Seminavis robusta TaxID=568900 RepID=A0A9N8HLA4_9STRA|nr:Patatin-like phospholipase domain-containing protein [Seminavis robusta]|eukprot:Sro900_g217850.1 Patatin-like phospholipase domain-containing protein (858) ;mRNA; f:20441-23414
MSTNNRSRNVQDLQLDLLHQALDDTARILIAYVPVLREISLELLDTVFVPRTVAKQLLLAIALEAGVLTYKQVTTIVKALLSNFSSRNRLIAELERQQKTVKDQDDWMCLAEAIDLAQGHTVWRSDPNCALYEKERINARIDEFVHLMRRRDIFELMFVLRGGIARNKFGLLHEGLFSRAMAGSKILVETYHNVVCAALDFVCDAPVREGEAPIPTDARLAFFNETRHAYGRSALILSGGAALGFYHCGVVKALMDNNLMPRVIGGSSAGSIVCSMLGTRTDDECRNDLLNVMGTNAPGHYGRLKLNFFAPVRSETSQQHAQSDIQQVLQNSAGAFKDGKRTWQLMIPIGLRGATSFIYDVVTGTRRPIDMVRSDTAHLRECCKVNIGDFTFQEAFDRTGRILNIVVTPLSKGDPPRLLNYLTAPHVLVWSAAAASSSLPGVFEANRLMVKDVDGTERYESATEMKFSDGSMELDLPMQQLSEMFNVNHFIISQANPHAVMFGTYNTEKSVWTHPVTGLFNSLLIFLKDQLRAWLTHAVELVGGRQIAPLFGVQRDFGTQVLTQEYEGRECDISMVPWISHRSLFSAFLHCIYNPDEDDFLNWVDEAERETWKHIPAIKSHIAEEITLDRCVQRLRRRLAAESLEKKRTNSYGAKMGERVPSFFTSPSLVNLGGLGVGDQTVFSSSQGDMVKDGNAQSSGSLGVGKAAKKEPIHSWTIPSGAVQSGWGGLGLQGNRPSASNLTRSHSSGLFIDDDEHRPHIRQQQEPAQKTGENASTGGGADRAQVADLNTTGGYVKTTSMAHFYYRRGGANPGMHKSVSDHKMLNQASADHPEVERRKSKSQSDLVSAAQVVLSLS